MKVKLGVVLTVSLFDPPTQSCETVRYVMFAKARQKIDANKADARIDGVSVFER